MNADQIQIRCKNNKKTRNFAKGVTLSEVFDAFQPQLNGLLISAKVNNKVEGLDFRLYHPKDVEAFMAGDR